MELSLPIPEFREDAERKRANPAGLRLGHPMRVPHNKMMKRTASDER